MRLFQGRPVRAVERILDANEADQRVLEHLEKLGCDPAAPRETTHYVYLPSRDGADAVAETLHHAGWLTSLESCDDDSWLVVAARVAPLTRAGVGETRRAFTALAAEHGGVYDGWEAKADDDVA